MHHSHRRRGCSADDALGLVYYNYRHLEPVTGRWLQRDVVEEFEEYFFCKNVPVKALLLSKHISESKI